MRGLITRILERDGDKVMRRKKKKRERQKEMMLWKEKGSEVEVREI